MDTIFRQSMYIQASTSKFSQPPCQRKRPARLTSILNARSDVERTNGEQDVTITVLKFGVLDPFGQEAEDQSDGCESKDGEGNMQYDRDVGMVGGI